MSDHAIEISSGDRFGFGANWARFLGTLNDARIAEAETSLKTWLGVERLDGKTFLDIGSGSGLFSLCARRLGARVFSFDYDPDSVGCTQELRRRYFPDDPDWTVESGSVLDSAYMQQLDQADIVYSWGVLHHTGSMWEAIENAQSRVAPGGTFYIAIYNDQGGQSRRLLWVKQAYNNWRRPLKWLVLGPAFLRLWGPTTLKDLLKGKPGQTWRSYSQQTLRGMDPWRDVVDWVGGLPFEVAKPEEIFDFLQERGFRLRKLETCAGGLGCNQFVFEKDALTASNGKSTR